MLDAHLKATDEWCEPCGPETECGVPITCDISQEDADRINAAGRKALRLGYEAAIAHPAAAPLVDRYKVDDPWCRPAAPLGRDAIARIIDPSGMSDGIRLRWALEKADAILALSPPAPPAVHPDSFTAHSIGRQKPTPPAVPLLQDQWFTDRHLPIMAMSADIESDRVLKLHFRRTVTDKDRADLIETLNAGVVALSTPPAVDREAIIKELHDIESWCAIERGKLGNIDGYNYASGEEYGVRKVEIEISKRIRALLDAKGTG